jgi:hypothetical protein
MRFSPESDRNEAPEKQPLKPKLSEMRRPEKRVAHYVEGFEAHGSKTDQHNLDDRGDGQADNDVS